MDTEITSLTIPQLLQRIKSEYGDTPAQYIKDATGAFQPRSFGRLYQEVLAMAAGLRDLGVGRGDHVGLISENRAEWMVCDLAILALGAADVPRGNDTMPQELQYILSFSECRTVIVENIVQLEKTAGVLADLPLVKTIVLLSERDEEHELSAEAQKALKGVVLKRYADVIETGRGALGTDGTAPIEDEIAEGTPQDVATIIFTSGTTGQPKGVVLTHHNFLHQVACIPNFVAIRPGDVWLAVLPVWHSFERIMQYISLGSASAQAYSKPVGKIMLGDFAAVRPQWMASVPRIWESVRSGVIKKARAGGGIRWALFRFFVAVGGTHKQLDNLVKGRKPSFRKRSRVLDFLIGFLPWLALWPLRALGNLLVFGKIKARLGGRFIAGISGGGALPSAVDQFFGAAGILLLEGYGLTETAPVVAVRKQRRPVPGTVGTLVDDTECQIRSEEGDVLPPGEQGVVYVRGPQVMSGYYRQPELTAEVLSEDGWFNTGDLGMLTHDNELKITGRAKDTIVLRGGENIEPLPIEQKLRESELIDQAVVLGQDQKFLGALIVPNAQAVQEALSEDGGGSGGADAGTERSLEDLVGDAQVFRIIEREIGDLVSAKNGFRGFEQIFRFRLVSDQFEIGKELSAKQEVKRHVISEEYAELISEMFS
jgi:long-chain acyl-CoA synthetase